MRLVLTQRGCRNPAGPGRDHWWEEAAAKMLSFLVPRPLGGQREIQISGGRRRKTAPVLTGALMGGRVHFLSSTLFLPGQA